MGRKIVSKTGMSVAEKGTWLFAIACSLGLLYPLYRMRKHQADRKTVTEVR